MAVDRSERRFIWHGALIVLPALLLAGAGGYLLWEDRRSAEHEAEQRAREMAGGVLTAVSNRVDAISPPRFDGSLTDSAARLDEAPLLRFAEANRDGLGFLTTTNGSLIYPPPVEPLPEPKPIQWHDIPEAAKEDWETAEASTHGPDSLDEGIAIWEGLLDDRELTPRLQTLAEYRLACHLKVSRKWQRAWEHFDALSRASREVRTETGLPLGPYIDLQKLSLLPELPSEA